MLKKLVLAAAVAAIALAATPLLFDQGVSAQQSGKKAVKASKVKAGKNQKVCAHRFPDGERRSWVCDKAVPCCAWDEIKYVKCGTTFTGCL